MAVFIDTKLRAYSNNDDKEEFNTSVPTLKEGILDDNVIRKETMSSRNDVHTRTIECTSIKRTENNQAASTMTNAVLLSRR